MSATAFYNFGPFTVLLSEGYAYRDGEIMERDARKIFPLSGSTALLWMGTRFEPIDAIINPVKGMNASDAIHNVANQLKDAIQGNSEFEDHLNNDRPFNIFTFEYEGEQLFYHRLFWVEDRFTPREKRELKPGMNGVLIVDPANDEEAQKMFKAGVRRYMDGRTHTEGEFIKATTKSFTAMVDHFNKAGVHVGGRIFQQTIKP
jgi:hypothetical protein